MIQGIERYNVGKRGPAYELRYACGEFLIVVFARGTRVSKHDIIQPHHHPSPPTEEQEREKNIGIQSIPFIKDKVLSSYYLFFLSPSPPPSTPPPAHPLSWLSSKKIKRSATLMWMPYLKLAAIILNTVTIWILLKRKNLSRSAWCVNSIIVSCFGRKSLYTSHLEE